MIVAILSGADPTGVKPVIEFRRAEPVPPVLDENQIEIAPGIPAETAAVQAFASENTPALDPAGFVGINTGWSVFQPPPPGAPWHYDFGAEALVTLGALAAAKRVRCTVIDAHTDVLIEQGFQFPPGIGAFYNLTVKSQMRIEGLDRFRDDPLCVYPVVWNSLNDLIELSIPDSGTLHSFYLVALSTLRTRIDSGTALKAQVRAAQTMEEVAAVQDNR